MLRVSVIELPARFGQPEQVLGQIDAALLGAGADLALLPEACLTGYVSPQGDYDLRPFREPLDGPTAGALAALARKHRTHLFAPLVLAEGSATYNAHLGFGPDGRHLATYRKRHPWFPERWATAGAAPLPLLEVGGLTVTLAICFDVHFLEAESRVQLEQADLLLFPSAWVEDLSADTRPGLLRDLATRFHLAVANANWAPGDVAVRGQGGSTIVGADGRVLAAVQPGQRWATAAVAPAGG